MHKWNMNIHYLTFSPASEDADGTGDEKTLRRSRGLSLVCYRAVFAHTCVSHLKAPPQPV